MTKIKMSEQSNEEDNIGYTMVSPYNLFNNMYAYILLSIYYYVQCQPVT